MVYYGAQFKALIGFRRIYFAAPFLEHLENYHTITIKNNCVFQESTSSSASLAKKSGTRSLLAFPAKLIFGLLNRSPSISRVVLSSFFCCSNSGGSSPTRPCRSRSSWQHVSSVPFFYVSACN